MQLNNLKLSGYNKVFIIWLITVLIFISVKQLCAEETASHVMDEIVVTSTNKSKMIDIPASISVITAEELSEMGAKNIVEAISKIPGVDNVSAKDSAISIRGTKSSMAGGPVILIDGVPQKIGDYRYDEFSFIPVSQIERIEVLRSAGIAYGPGAARGVINVITKKGKTGVFNGDVSVSYGSWNTHNEYAGFSGSVNRWDYFVNTANYSTDGYEEEEEDRISALVKVGYNLSDQTRIGIRGNYITHDQITVDGFSKFEWQKENYRRDIHFPRSETDPTLIWHNSKDQDIATAAFEFSHKGNGLFIDSNISWTGYEEDYRRSYALYTSPTSVYHDDKEQDTYTATLSGGYDFNIGAISYTPSIGLNFEDIEFSNFRIYPYDPAKDTDSSIFDFEERQYGVFWDNDLVLSEHWGLKIGGRVDRVEIDFKDRVPNKVDESNTMYSWLIAPSYRFSEKATVYISAGRNYWFPTPRYYAWAAESGGDLNRPEDLKPEKSLTYEIGYRNMLHKTININLTTYFTEYNDKFSTVYNPPATTSYGQKNVGEAEARGIELEVDGRLCRYFGYRLAGTYQKIEWKSGQMVVYDHPSNDRVFRDLDGYRVDHVPEYSGLVGLDFYPFEGLKLGVDVNYTGSQYVDYLNRIKYSSKTTCDANISYKVNNWKIWVLGKNIFDRKIEYVSNTTGRLTGADGEPRNYYYIQDGAYVEAGISVGF